MGYVQDLIEKRREFLAGRITRREFDQALATVGLVSTAFPLAATSAYADDSQATVFTWSGYEDKHFMKSYIAKYGAPPQFSFFADEEEAYAKLRSGFTADILMPCTYKVPSWHRAGLLKPIDTSKISNWPDVISSLKKIPGTIYKDQHYHIPMDYGFTAVTYRTDLAPEYEAADKQTWGILWDKKFSGRLSMIDSLIDGVAVACIYAGVNPFDLSKADIKTTHDLLAKQRPLLRFYTSDSTTWEQALASGELIAAATWNSSPKRLRDQGIPVKFMMPDAPALNGKKQAPMTWVCGLCMSTSMDKSHEQKAYDVIDSYLDVDSGYYEVTEWATGHANQLVYEKVDEAALKDLGLSKNPDSLLSKGIFQSEMKQEAQLQTMFEEVKAGM